MRQWLNFQQCTISFLSTPSLDLSFQALSDQTCNTKFMNPPQCLSASKSNDIAYGGKHTYIFWGSLADQIHTIYKAVRMDVIIKAQTFFTSME